MIRVRDPKNLACAALFVGFAGVLAAAALSLPIGTASAMGPGYFPLALALILGALGVVLGVISLRYDGAPVTRFEWRGFVLVTLAIVAFAVTIRRLGFVPSATIAIVLAMLAGGRLHPLRALVSIALLVAFCWAVFIRGLGLPIALFGS